ncbi:hypothetical protein N7471_011532, partial [Penicillium samsonianum]|uniref:uncharacterized protein n=1 Tax=Penicillium samsonianum TaxID=1882272 RepID=UPI00254927B9
SSPKKDLPAPIWTPAHFLSPSSSSSLFLPFANSLLYNSFVSFVWVIVRLYFPARHARFARASIPRSLNRSALLPSTDLTPLEAFIV